MCEYCDPEVILRRRPWMTKTQDAVAGVVATLLPFRSVRELAQCDFGRAKIFISAGLTNWLFLSSMALLELLR